MRYGIALTGDRVAARCIFAESVLVVVLRGNRARAEERKLLESHGLLTLAEVLAQSRVEALICCGISSEEREFLIGRRMEIIDNVAASVHEIMDALQSGVLRPGFGLAAITAHAPRESLAPETRDRHTIPGPIHAGAVSIDCLACRNRRCFQGEPCDVALLDAVSRSADPESELMFEAMLDIASEQDRTLCRLSELIYLCLEMSYERIGVAYCADLQEPTEILVRVLRRFIKVHPVCCKIGGFPSFPSTLPTAVQEAKLMRSIACNPRGQAEVMNRVQTDINVLVGLCMGADCIFSRFSKAPVTTLVVKDKALANNPIGALYSGRYLKEAIQAAPRGSLRSQSNKP